MAVAAAAVRTATRSWCEFTALRRRGCRRAVPRSSSEFLGVPRRRRALSEELRGTPRNSEELPLSATLETWNKPLRRNLVATALKDQIELVVAEKPSSRRLPPGSHRFRPWCTGSWRIWSWSYKPDLPPPRRKRTDRALRGADAAESEGVHGSARPEGGAEAVERALLGREPPRQYAQSDRRPADAASRRRSRDVSAADLPGAARAAGQRRQRRRSSSRRNGRSSNRNRRPAGAESGATRRRIRSTTAA